MLVIGLGSGFLLGSVIATLFAPSSGKQLRMKMVDMVDGVSARVNMFKEPGKYSRIKP